MYSKAVPLCGKGGDNIVEWNIFCGIIVKIRAGSTRSFKIVLYIVLFAVWFVLLACCNDVVAVKFTDHATAIENIRLLYFSTVRGVDWSLGIIRATGTGQPPPTATNATTRREMAKCAALVDAQRTLLIS